MPVGKNTPVSYLINIIPFDFFPTQFSELRVVNIISYKPFFNRTQFCRAIDFLFLTGIQICTLFFSQQD